MRTLAFHQVDVFGDSSLKGNALAVVVDADELSDTTMASFAKWTNLSETTFLLKPTVPGADCRVRIFTTAGELSLAGHPTLGSCQVWLDSNGKAKQSRIVQECRYRARAFQAGRRTPRLCSSPASTKRRGRLCNNSDYREWFEDTSRVHQGCTIGRQRSSLGGRDAVEPR